MMGGLSNASTHGKSHLMLHNFIIGLQLLSWSQIGRDLRLAKILTEADPVFICSFYQFCLLLRRFELIFLTFKKWTECLLSLERSQLHSGTWRTILSKEFNFIVIPKHAQAGYYNIKKDQMFICGRQRRIESYFLIFYLLCNLITHGWVLHFFDCTTEILLTCNAGRFEILYSWTINCNS
jgi:hypothetical protein